MNTTITQTEQYVCAYTSIHITGDHCTECNRLDCAITTREALDSMICTCDICDLY